jgi:poly-gamma-glutamate synthesis protein (capsule biosynthesis protein)
LLLLALLAALHRGENLDRRVTLGAVGDIQLGVNLRHPEELPGGDPFALVRGALAADLTVGNLEGPVPAPAAREIAWARGPHLRQPPTVGALLREAGFDLVSLANNHLLDYGVPSVVATLEVLREAGVEPVGAWPDPADRFHPVIRTVHGVSIGFLAYSMWLNVVGGRETVGLGLLRTDDAVAEIAALRPYVDFVVVLAHWERENDHFTYGETRELARAMVDAGADVVLGHHAHVLKGLEWYRGALIAYSLGNFVFGPVRGAQAESAVLRLELVRQANGRRRIAEARLTPVLLDGPRSIPRAADGRRRARLLRLLRTWSHPLGARIDDDGFVRPRDVAPDDRLGPRFRGWRDVSAAAVD